MAPRRAAEQFLARHPEAAAFRVTLYGSLAATGRGHMTDRAIIDTLLPTAPVDIVWQAREFLPFHPNGMRFEALDTAGTPTDTWTVYSIGGGELADPKECKMVADLGVTMLAAGIGNIHGVYPANWKGLNFDVLTAIRDRVKVPLVMHGGSGVSDEDYVKAINAGIRKVNYYTYGAKFAGEAATATVDRIRNSGSGQPVYWHDLTCAAYDRLVEDFTSVIKVFANGAEPLA